MLKNFFTIMFYDPDRGWVQDSLETEVAGDREGVSQALKTLDGAPKK